MVKNITLWDVYKITDEVDIKNIFCDDDLQITNPVAKDLPKLLAPHFKQIIDSMQDKTIMHKVNKVIRFSETKEAMLHKQKLEAGRKVTKETLDDVLINYEILEEAKNDFWKWDYLPRGMREVLG